MPAVATLRHLPQPAQSPGPPEEPPHPAAALPAAQLPPAAPLCRSPSTCTVVLGVAGSLAGGTAPKPQALQSAKYLRERDCEGACMQGLNLASAVNHKQAFGFSRCCQQRQPGGRPRSLVRRPRPGAPGGQLFAQRALCRQSQAGGASVLRRRCTDGHRHLPANNPRPAGAGPLLHPAHLAAAPAGASPVRPQGRGDQTGSRWSGGSQRPPRTAALAAAWPPPLAAFGLDVCHGSCVGVWRG